MEALLKICMTDQMFFERVKIVLKSVSVTLPDFSSKSRSLLRPEFNTASELFCLFKCSLLACTVLGSYSKCMWSV